MKRILFLFAVCLVLLLALVLLAWFYLGLALGFGYAMKRLIGMDLFHGMLVSLVPIGVAATVVFLALRDFIRSMMFDDFSTGVRTTDFGGSSGRREDSMLRDIAEIANSNGPRRSKAGPRRGGRSKEQS